MYSKSKIEREGFYWFRQIERHRIGKRIREFARKIEDRQYKKLSILLGVSRKTIWAIANGLATSSKSFLYRLERLEEDFKDRLKMLEEELESVESRRRRNY